MTKHKRLRPLWWSSSGCSMLDIWRWGRPLNQDTIDMLMGCEANAHHTLCGSSYRDESLFNCLIRQIYKRLLSRYAGSPNDFNRRRYHRESLLFFLFRDHHNVLEGSIAGEDRRYIKSRVQILPNFPLLFTHVWKIAWEVSAKISGGSFWCTMVTGEANDGNILGLAPLIFDKPDPLSD